MAGGDAAVTVRPRRWSNSVVEPGHALSSPLGRITISGDAIARIVGQSALPVPDGETGTNLTLTVRSLRDSLSESEAEERVAIARDVTRGALMGARGNSGVILSQIVRGAAEALGEVERIDARTVA